MAVKLNWTRLQSVQVSRSPSSKLSSRRRPAGFRRRPTAQSANVSRLCKHAAAATLYRQLNRYRIKRISNLEYDRSCGYMSFADRLRAASNPAYKTSQFYRPALRPASPRWTDERSDGSRLTAFARLIRPMPDGTCTVGRQPWLLLPSWTATVNATKGDPVGDVTAKRNIYLSDGRWSWLPAPSTD